MSGRVLWCLSRAESYAQKNSRALQIGVLQRAAYQSFQNGIRTASAAIEWGHFQGASSECISENLHIDEGRHICNGGR